MLKGWCVIVMLSLFGLACSQSPAAETSSGGGEKKPESKPAAASDKKNEKKDAKPTESPRATAVFAGGCFWCVEAVFEELEGVISAESGYAGGSAETANYKAVCTGTTGHAEAVRITYDPSKISFQTLLQVHFATHDPTTLNRQGADRGTQYRSAVFYQNDTEKKIAEEMIKHINESGKLPSPVVTTLEPLKAFYPAEMYHQNFVCNNPYQGYVQAVAMPKVAKVRDKFKDLVKKDSPVEKALKQ
jgi:methionine-S-sulfoxide reductase